jgi:hypothetical protein
MFIVAKAGRHKFRTCVGFRRRLSCAPWEKDKPKTWARANIQAAEMALPVKPSGEGIGGQIQVTCVIEPLDGHGSIDFEFGNACIRLWEFLQFLQASPRQCR